MRSLYKALVPYETRYWFHKLRNWHKVESKRYRVNPSPKGVFSLRAFDVHRCIFVHVPKAAGTSVAHCLFGELPYHYTAVEYRVIFGRRTFDDYFKFTFVRNPWDRLYSAYSYLKGGGWNEKDRHWADRNLACTADFRDFVLNWLSKERLHSHTHFVPQSHFLCDRRGRILVDYLGYFETLNDDFRLIARRLCMDSRIEHRNASARSSYLHVYSDEMKEKVNELYASDINRFGYSFEGIRNRMRIVNGATAPS